MVNLKSSKKKAKTGFVWPKNVKKWWLPIYGGTLGFTNDRVAWETVWNHFNPESPVSAESALGMTGYIPSKEEGRIYIVGSFPPYTTNQTRFSSPEQVLVHEIGHATFDILDSVGVPATPRDNEAFCYLQDFLYSVLIKELEPWPHQLPQ